MFSISELNKRVDGPFELINVPEMFAGSTRLRSLSATVMMLAWLVASNHCTFAAPMTGNIAKPPDGMPSDCPMHQQHAPQPDKQNGCGDLPCCKSLQATAAPIAKLVTKPM